MNNDLKPTRVYDCKVCYVQHSDDIHEATLRIRRWLRYEVTRKLNEGLPQEVEENPALVA
jgi:Zn-finger protein